MSAETASVPAPGAQEAATEFRRRRTRLTWLGLGSPTSGLWVTPDATLDRAVHDVIRDLGLESQAFAWTGSASGLGDEQRLLADAWDLVVWVHAEDAVRVARMAVRDGVSADPDHPDQRRYLDAQLIYLTRCRPLARADVVIDNTCPAAPRIHRITPRTAPLAQNDPS